MKAFFAALLMAFISCAFAVESVSLPGVENCYRISAELYRSAQPEPVGFAALQNAGVRSVLNLREYHAASEPEWRGAPCHGRVFG